jgi:hypothetical protein
VRTLLFCSALSMACMSSFCGMFEYMFVILNEHSFMLPCVLVSFSLCMSSLEFCMLNALGGCIVF